MFIRSFLKTIPILLCFQLYKVMCMGVFEVTLVRLHDPQGAREDGRCCHGDVSTSTPCSRDCDTFVTVCLLYTVQSVERRPPCPYGSATSRILDFSDVTSGHSDVTLSIPVTFMWPVNITVVVDIWRDINGQASIVDDSQLMTRTIITTSLPPSHEWIIYSTNIPSTHLNTSSAHLNNASSTHQNTSYRQKNASTHNTSYINNTTSATHSNTSSTHHNTSPSDHNTSSQNLTTSSTHPTTSTHSNNNTSSSNLTTSTIHIYKYRFYCQPHYYGNGCEVKCRPRNDRFGHHRCLHNGTRVCLTGWTGPLCDKPVCRDECNRNRGVCELPNKCRCVSGWTGDNCGECVTMTGCLHGFCHQPYQCICHGGWRGERCDIDMNYCTRERPCYNGGVCMTDSTGNYTCQCPVGYIGDNCQYPSCHETFCQHGGQCLTKRGQPYCECMHGYHGSRCQHRKITCRHMHCENGGVCELRRHGPRCICPDMFTGNRCETRHGDPCAANPCKHGEEECRVSPNSSDINFVCSPLCITEGTGKQCTSTLNPCDKLVCQNSGQCVVEVVANQTTALCRCVNGYYGDRCESKWDPCTGITCLNSGMCKLASSGNGFVCECVNGYHGEVCELEKKPCDSSPCLNKGVCRNKQSSFRCRCQKGFQGRLCEKQSKPTTVVTKTLNLTTSAVTKPLNLTTTAVTKPLNLATTAVTETLNLTNGETVQLTTDSDRHIGENRTHYLKPYHDISGQVVSSRCNQIILSYITSCFILLVYWLL